jgi:two-component system, response regulator, stage 0 sporulation protein F
MTKRVLNVGQCVPDHGSITRFLQSAFDVHVEKIDSPVDALDQLRQRPCDLVLINRKLDADYSDGTDVLCLIKSDPALAHVPVMIVTNYKEHQDNAVALGAVYGFGKNELGASDVIARLEPYLKA